VNRLLIGAIVFLLGAVVAAWGAFDSEIILVVVGIVFCMVGGRLISQSHTHGRSSLVGSRRS
jgi:hypothetical protein